MDSCNLSLKNSPNSPSSSSLDVLVIGATPAGLASALAYARLGLSVRIMEAHSDLSPLNGSVSLNSRSLEILEALGISEKIISLGHKINQIQVRNHQYSEVAKLDFINLHHKYPFLLTLPQYLLEKTLSEFLNTYGIKIEFSSSFSSQTQEDNLVNTLINTPQGEINISSKIVVAADGEFSSLRRKLKIGFGLTEYPHYFSLADIQTNLDYGDANFCLLKNGFLYTQRIKNNLYRVVSNLPHAHTYLPQRIKPEELIWQSERRITTHQLRSYQYGRVFFVGDSAHQHLPFDGRDLSMGLEDAVTLAAMTMDQCLEHYHDHRYKANLRVLYDSEKLLNLSKPKSAFYTQVRNWTLKNLLSQPMVQSKILAGMSGV